MNINFHWKRKELGIAVVVILLALIILKTAQLPSLQMWAEIFKLGPVKENVAPPALTIELNNAPQNLYISNATSDF